MALTSSIDALAKHLQTLDPGDLAGLVAAQEGLESIVTEAGAADRAGLATTGREAGDLVTALIMRDADDLDATFRRLGELVTALHAAAHDAPVPASEPAAADDAGGQHDRGVDLELLGHWLSSTQDHLTGLEAAFIAIADGTAGDETFDEARRSMHTLKGEAGFLALDAVQTLTHEAETLLDRTGKADRPLPIDHLLALVDYLATVVETLGEDPAATLPPHAELLDRLRSASTAAEGPAPAASPAAVSAPAGPARPGDDEPVSFPEDMGMDENLADFIGESREHFAAAEASLLELESDPTDNEQLNTVFRAFHTVKGVAGFMNLTPVVEFAHEAETLLDHARTGRRELNPPLLDLVLRSCDHLGRLVNALEDEPAPTVGEHRHLLDTLQRAIRGEDPAQPRDAVPAPLRTSAATEVAPKPSPAPARGGEGRRPRVEQTVKVAASRLDTLVTMVGELVIAQQMVAQDPNVQALSDVRLQRSLSEVGKIIRDLQNVSMALSMVPVKGTFQKMARLVRDVSAKAGKQVVFSMEGEDTELDRNVIEEIGDPLVHMVRNACDHGVERPADRAAAGKTEQGSLILRAYHQGGSIVIEIQDDGRGLDRDRILGKATERGLVGPDRNPAEIPDHEIYNMIFAPGFSTAEKITDISGRGVGMDVVRRNIEALRGTVEIDSTPGRGSTFRMKLPLTMAIIDGMVVGVGGHRFVVPTLAIEQSFQPRDEDLETTMQDGEMARIRGSLLPIHRLKRTFGLVEGHDALTDSLLLVLESPEGRFCLAVDHILGQQQVVIKTLGDGVAPLRGVAGGAILGDGRVALILDIPGILELSLDRKAGPPACPSVQESTS